MTQKNQNPNVNMFKDENASKPEKGSFSNKNLATMAGIAILTVAVSSGLFSSEKGDNKPAPKTEMSTTLINYPVETTAEKPKLSDESMLTVEKLEIDASVLSDPAETLKTFINKRMTDWINAGATAANAKEAIKSGDVEGYVAEKAAQYDQVFIEALLTDDWQSNPETVEWVNKMSLTHQNTLLNYIQTSADGNSTNKEPYEKWNQVSEYSIVSRGKTDDKIVLFSTEQSYDNSTKNSVKDKTEPKESKTIASYSTVDGKVKISNIIHHR